MLVNENSMYPQPFDIQLLAPNSKMRKFVEFSTQLHTKSPTDALKDISRYPHLCYFFDQHNKSLLFKFWELVKPNTRGGVALGMISKCILLSPVEYHLVHRSDNLLVKLKSLISVKTLFNNKSKRQNLCREINDLFFGVSDYMKLAAIVMYPEPISIVFDYTAKASLECLHKRFIIGCKGQRVNIDNIVNGICIELFGEDFTTSVFDEFKRILDLKIDFDDLQHFKDRLNNRLVNFQGQCVKFGKVKSISPVGRELMLGILFNKTPVAFGVTPPPIVHPNTINVSEILMDNIKYPSLKFVVGFSERALHEIYYALWEEVTWVWYIDVSALSLDQHCTAHILLKTAYTHSVKLGMTYKYNWEIFLDMYTKHKAVLLFAGIDKLPNVILARRILKIIQRDITCERWIGLCGRELIDGPKLDLQRSLDSLQSKSYDILIHGRPTIKKSGMQMIEKWLNKTNNLI
jgi:hypothetical protein